MIYQKKNKYKTVKKVIYFINILLLFINIFLVLNNVKKDIFKHYELFKYSDLFDINLYKNSYQDISSYLKNKFNINNKLNLLQNVSFFQKIIRIKGTGSFNKKFYSKWLKSKLDSEFILQFVDSNPDYLIYNVFDDQDKQIKYKNAVRIAIYTENVMPDLNYADYILGHYHINYLDRYFKHTIFFWNNFTSINKVRKEVLKSPIRNKFCAALISNCAAKFRLKFINKLNQYKKVDIGGNCKNNINRKITNKNEFFSDYKFSIAMENSRGDGYSSEKLVDSFLAGTIPIYYGDYLIDEFINPKTYILINGKNDIENKIEYIKRIDMDDKLYLDIMKEKPIIDNNFVNTINNKELKLFLNHIFKEDKNKAFRRDNNYYEYNCKNEN